MLVCVGRQTDGKGEKSEQKCAGSSSTDRRRRTVVGWLEATASEQVSVCVVSRHVVVKDRSLTRLQVASCLVSWLVDSTFSLCKPLLLSVQALCQLASYIVLYPVTPGMFWRENSGQNRQSCSGKLTSCLRLLLPAMSFSRFSSKRPRTSHVLKILTKFF